MDILVPTDKPHLPHPAALVGLVRTLATMGFVGYVLLFSMVFSEGKVHFPYLRRTVLLVLLSLVGFLLTFRWPRVGAILLAAGMIVALVLTPVQLSEWRPWFFSLEGFMALTGLLFVLTPHKRE